MRIRIHYALALLEGFTDKHIDFVRGVVSYHDKSAEFEYRKFKTNRWYAAQNGQDAYDDELKRLKDAQTQVVLFQNEEGWYTYAGLAESLAQKLRVRFQEPCPVMNSTPVPYCKPIPWKKQPHPPRPYQKQFISDLEANVHSCIQSGTGTGKSLVIAYLCRNVGLKTIVMAPSKSIASQLYDNLVALLGESKVGFVGDGKKKPKLITVGIAASLTKIEPGDPLWDALSDADVFITDESHFLAATTFEKVGLGLAGRASRRWSVSGTQIRGDGSGILLDGLIGPTVGSMTVQEGVDQGYLAKPVFHMFRVTSDSSYHTDDVSKMTRVHLYQNKKVLQLAGALVQKSVAEGKPTVVLIDEVEQFTRLLPHLPSDVKFAHGGLASTNKNSVPAAYHKSDPKALVKDFNEGKFNVLVGTSCIATGTDILPVEAIVMLTGGKSVVQVSQAIGRGTRLVGSKKECQVYDFMPMLYLPQVGVDDNTKDWSVVRRHAHERVNIYNSIYPTCKVY